MSRNVLIVAAHPDDEVLACGGTMKKFSEIGYGVYVLILAEGVTSRYSHGNRERCSSELDMLAESTRKAAGILGVKKVKLGGYPDNKMDAVEMLDVVKFVEGCIDEYQPEMVFTHHESDLNIDHKIAGLATVTACRPLPNQVVKTILFFEVPSNTGWHCSQSTAAFSPNWFVDISSTLRFKIKALEEYGTEMRPWPHARSLEAVTHLAKWRGSSVGVEAAEAFVLGRNLIGIKPYNTGEAMKEILIAGRMISRTSPCFVIAEMSANHRQDLSIAVETLKAMKKAGADAVKLQTYTPDTITIDCDNEYFQIKHGTIWDGKNLYDLYKEAYTPWEWHPILKKVADEIGLIFFSTPFDRSAVDFLETTNVPAYKVASLEITDIPLIEYIASKGKPVLISTGVATLSDITEAIEACKRAGNEQVIILKCTTEYPTPLEDVNINTIPNMTATFNKVVGLSDHTLGISVPIAAVALGACMVEKHFILSKDLGGPDAAFSLDPQEFASMVKSIREVEKALGKVSYELSAQTIKNRGFCRSLFIVEDMKKGETFTSKNIRSIRPGYGLGPKYLNIILGQKARQAIKRGTPLRWQLIEK